MRSSFYELLNIQKKLTIKKNYKIKIKKYLIIKNIYTLRESFPQKIIDKFFN